MKTDNFDDAFRRKVESFHPPFRDDEIDRIQGYVNQHIPLSFWQRFGHTFTYTLGTIIIVSLLTSIIYQANENKTLLNKISDLSNKLEQKQAAIAVEDVSKNIIVEKTDTVYVIKHITKEVPMMTEQTTAVKISLIEKNITDISAIESENDKRNISPTEKKAISPASSDENPEEIVRSISSNKAKKTVPKVSQQKQSTVHASSNSLDKNVIVRSNQKNEVENNVPAISQKNELAIINAESKTFDKTGNITNNTQSGNIAKLLTINDLKRRTFSLIDLKFTFDLSSKKFQLPHFVAKPKTHKSFKFPIIAMPNLKYRVGLGANADFGQIGTSVLADVLFAKRWSITSGINMALLGFEHFGDEADFKRKTDKDFRDEHPITVPSGNAIKNIESHQLLFRVPIYLNYRLPLRQDYTVLFSTGTDLDFHLKQFTSYLHYDFGRNDEHEGIEEKIPVMPFNNWMFSAGIEKRWNHFSVQLSPYLTYQIKQVSYRKEDFAFGLKINGFYRISR
jgi:hypothetical protein